MRSALVAGTEPHAQFLAIAAVAKRSHSVGEGYTEAVADLENEHAVAEQCNLADVGRNRKTAASVARCRCLASTRMDPLLASRRYSAC